jgi:large subunit ribosomal protein L13
MRTSVARKESFTGDWYLIDADGQVLGRLATKVAKLLMGKHRPAYTPHVDAGDHVVIVNASGIRVTGDKFEAKEYHTHSFYPDGHKVKTYRQMVERFPTRPIELAVKRMLPKNRLQALRMRRLHVYAGPKHQHQAQKPVTLG